jgi:hypothetical protein
MRIKYARNNKEIITEIDQVKIQSVTVIQSATVIRLDISDFTQAKDNLQ